MFCVLNVREKPTAEGVSNTSLIRRRSLIALMMGGVYFY